MSTHIEANKIDIAENILMPGDPLRAKYIAQKYLENAKLINTVRNNLGFTGKYKNKKITVISSGMGNPSMGIYSYELYKFYNVKNIIRIGTAGAYKKEIPIKSLILAEESFSKSTFALCQNEYKEEIIKSSKTLNEQIIKTAKRENMKLFSGRVLSSDVFYNYIDNEEPIQNNCLACEMESFALFHNAQILNKNAACILTISNIMGENHGELSAEEREKSLNDMIMLALETYCSE